MRFTLTRKPLVRTELAPRQARLADDGTLVLDFGRAAFGTLALPPMPACTPMPRAVHLGEKADHAGRIDRHPPGGVRYTRIEQPAAGSATRSRLVIPPDKRNTGPAAIRMPPEIGEVYPFRYAEIEQARGIDPAAVRQVAVHYPFDDRASAFASSDPILNAIWDLCKYTIKATTYCGIYVDGDRERIPYEADAYINQLGHYGVDQEYTLARYTHEYLIQRPTWPTEWHLHSVMMAWADYLYTGEVASLQAFYEDLRVKTLAELADADGLISTASERCTEAFEKRLHLHWPGTPFGGLKDIVDWPPGSFTDGGTGERDGHEMRPVNTVVNAFHYRALVLFARIAAALGHAKDADRFTDKANRVRTSFHRRLFDPARGVFIDGVGSQHASLHSNMFALAFGLVPEARRQTVLAFVQSRGMACSVYGAQYLLEALYLNHADTAARRLMTAQHDRSWWHMLASGATLTWEAWDVRYKNNLDWNHAWGAAPANIIPRFVLGVRPLTPGFGNTLIQPLPGGLEHATGKVPTPHGPVKVAFRNAPDDPFSMELTVPQGMTVRAGLPCRGRQTDALLLDGRRVEADVRGDTVFADGIGPGTHRLSLSRPGPRP